MRKLEPGDKVRLVDGSSFSWGGKIATVDRVVSEPLEHDRVYFRESRGFCIPGQLEHIEPALSEYDEHVASIVAMAIKKCTDQFGNPVSSYIKPEAQRLWEEQNPDGDWYDQPEADDDLASYRIIGRAVVKAMRG